MITLRANVNGTWIDITSVTGNYTRSDNIDALGMSFNFDLLNNPLDAKFNRYEIPIGSKVVLSNNGANVFSGIVISYGRSSMSKYAYKAYDFGFYLNKSEAMIQFNNTYVSEAIKKLCNENSIPVGAVTNISTNVSKIYNGDKISDIIKDLLKMGTNELGTKYRLEVRDNKLYIDKYEDLVLTAYYKPARNVGGFNSANYPGGFSSNYSIENMSNRVLIVSSSEKHASIQAAAEDSGNISKYGLLTKVEKLDDKNKSQATNIAKTKLKELNKVTRSFKITLFGDDKIRSGRMIVFNQPEINLVGTYLVKNCTHKYNGRSHIMELDLEV